MAHDANGSGTGSPDCVHLGEASSEAWAEHVAVACVRYGGMVIHVARGYLGNPQDAEDVAQDLWVYLLEHPNGKALTAPYLRACTKYRCWQFRAERSKAHHEQTRIADFLRIFVHPDVQQNERFDALLRWLRSAIRKLPPAERKVVRRTLEGLSIEEIAARQDAKTESVDRAFLRAVVHLRRLARGDAIPKWASRARAWRHASHDTV